MTLLEGLLWLTLNVYHEARSEPQIGQVAVALVTLNRANESHLPIRDVVNQPYQFSWTNDQTTLLPDDPSAFLKCMYSAYLALQSDDFTDGATYYHLDKVKPYWSSEFTYLNQYGSHKFYK